MLVRHANLIRNESGYVLAQIIDCQLKIVKFNPIGSAYRPLPKHLALTNAIVNVHNSDERCFGYGVRSAIFDPLRGHHKSKARSYTEADFEKYHLDQHHYPVPVLTVPDLEETLDISFTVISFSDDEGRGLYTMYNTKHERAQHVDLLYFNEHYAWIKNVNKLVGCLSKDGHQLFYHKNCGSRFVVEEEFTRH